MINKRISNLVYTILIFIVISNCAACSDNKNDSIFTDTNDVITDKNSYYIIEGGIEDHSNPAIVHSIAWYFATYGEGKKYILATSGANYKINNTITIPSNCVLKGNDSVRDYTILASTGIDKRTMVIVGSGCKVQWLTIDGNREPSAVVSVSGTKGTIFKNCTIQNSKNDFIAADGDVYTILVNGSSSINLVIDSCQLNNAGANPKVNSTNNISKGYGVLLWGAVNATIQNCSINFTTTCGIDITGAMKATISGNTIMQTGLNRNLAGAIADGITGYHNWKTSDEDFYLYGNTINYAGNHGIHVSGRNINIQNNTISNQQLSAIMVDDWRTTAPGNEYSENVTIKNNKCTDPLSWVWQPGNSNRKIYIDRVNSGLTLDYNVNQDITGTLLSVTATNYHFPILIGTHQ